MSNQTNSQPRGEARKIETRGGINVRDLVNVAVFTVIYLIIFFAFAMTGIVPVMAVFYPLPIALIASIPNALFYTRGRKFGLVTIEGALLGLILFLTGMGGPLGLAAGIVCGLVADLIMRSGDYKSFSRTLVAHCIFNLWILGTQAALWLQRDAYLEPFRASQGDAFIDSTMALLSGPVFAVELVGVIACGAVGLVIGRAILKKHFERAGVA